MSFTKKLIRATITIAGASGDTVKVLDGYRISCEVETTGGWSASTAEIAIYGMTLSDMNKLTNLGTQYTGSYPNLIAIDAGDASGLSRVFLANITNAWFDGNNQPQAAFRIIASTIEYHAQTTADPISTTGTTDVAGMMSGLAKTMGVAFENAGVTAKLASSYYFGSPWSMAQQIAQDAGILYVIENNTLVITQPGTARKGSEIIISPETGLLGYPTFNQRTVLVTALFNPQVKFQGQVTIKSSLPSATGKFLVNKLSYSLESMVPGGRWFMHLECIPPTGASPT
jgi:hypothetical protein